jgi:hypothetical protein
MARRPILTHYVATRPVLTSTNWLGTGFTIAGPIREAAKARNVSVASLIRDAVLAAVAQSAAA